MPTEKQLAANRLNAQKSTGPKTPQGKARVAANAVTHGLTATCPVLNSEDPAAYARFRTGMTARLAPAGDIETLLADRVINLAWRLQRAQNYESYVLDNLIHSAADNPAPDVPASPDASVSTILAQILLDDFTGPQVLEKLQRYESRIERGFYKALKELRQTQSNDPMISPCKDNSSLHPRHGIEESSQRGGPAKPSLTVEHSEPSIHSNRIVDHPSKPNPHDPRRGYVDKPNPVPPRGTDVVVDHTNPQSPIFSSAVLNKLLQNKPNSGGFRVSAM